MKLEGIGFCLLILFVKVPLTKLFDLAYPSCTRLLSFQINLKDCSNSDIERNFTGSDILHKHSINSLLEQNSDIINRGLASPNEGK